MKRFFLVCKDLSFELYNMQRTSVSKFKSKIKKKKKDSEHYSFSNLKMTLNSLPIEVCDVDHQITHEHL